MLEIVADLAPKSQLFYATAFGGPASFAQNIIDLRVAGCDVIVDDVGYADEFPFQDDQIAQAVNLVTANGAMYSVYRRATVVDSPAITGHSVAGVRMMLVARVCSVATIRPPWGA